jgi:hypothetical protein
MGRSESIGAATGIQHMRNTQWMNCDLQSCERYPGMFITKVHTDRETQWEFMVCSSSINSETFIQL